MATNNSAPITGPGGPPPPVKGPEQDVGLNSTDSNVNGVGQNILSNPPVGTHPIIGRRASLSPAPPIVGIDPNRGILTGIDRSALPPQQGPGLQPPLPPAPPQQGPGLQPPLPPAPPQQGPGLQPPVRADSVERPPKGWGPGKSEMKKFRKAILSGDLGKVEKMLSKHPDLVNGCENMYLRPLELASVLPEPQRTETIRLLFANGANPNIVDKNGNTLLHRACFVGDMNFAKMLVNNGASDAKGLVNNLNYEPWRIASLFKYDSLATYLGAPEVQPPLSIRPPRMAPGPQGTPYGLSIPPRDLQINYDVQIDNGHGDPISHPDTWFDSGSVQQSFQNIAARYEDGGDVAISRQDLMMNQRFGLGKTSLRKEVEDFINNKKKQEDPPRFFAAPVYLQIDKNTGSTHWALVVVDRDKETIEFYDSSDQRIDVNKELKKTAKKVGYTYHEMPTQEFQQDNSSCGVYANLFLQHRLENADEDIETIKELLTGLKVETENEPQLEKVRIDAFRAVVHDNAAEFQQVNDRMFVQARELFAVEPPQNGPKTFDEAYKEFKKEFPYNYQAKMFDLHLSGRTLYDHFHSPQLQQPAPPAPSLDIVEEQLKRLSSTVTAGDETELVDEAIKGAFPEVSPTPVPVGPLFTGLQPPALRPDLQPVSAKDTYGLTSLSLVRDPRVDYEKVYTMGERGQDDIKRPHTWLEGEDVSPSFSVLAYSYGTDISILSGHEMDRDIRNISRFDFVAKDVSDFLENRKKQTYPPRFFAAPVHVSGNHWGLLVVDAKENRIEYYDSLYDENVSDVKKIVSELQKSAKSSKYTFHQMPTAGIQKDGTSCGVYAHLFLKYRLENKEKNIEEMKKELKGWATRASADEQSKINEYRSEHFYPQLAEYRQLKDQFRESDFNRFDTNPPNKDPKTQSAAYQRFKSEFPLNYISKMHALNKLGLGLYDFYHTPPPPIPPAGAETELMDERLKHVQEIQNLEVEEEASIEPEASQIVEIEPQISALMNIIENGSDDELNSFLNSIEDAGERKRLARGGNPGYSPVVGHPLMKAVLNKNDNKIRILLENGASSEFDGYPIKQLIRGNRPALEVFNRVLHEVEEEKITSESQQITSNFSHAILDVGVKLGKVNLSRVKRKRLDVGKKLQELNQALDNFNQDKRSENGRKVIDQINTVVKELENVIEHKKKTLSERKENSKLELVSLLKQINKSVLEQCEIKPAPKADEKHVNSDNLIRAAGELISTETSYNKKIKSYQKALVILKDNGDLEEGDYKLLSGNLKEIIDTSDKLLRDLSQLDLEKPDEIVTQLPRVMTQNTQRSLGFQHGPYIARYEAINEVVRKLDSQKTDAIIDALIKSKVEGNDALSGLSPLAILPIQRMPRYNMLLGEISKQSGDSNLQQITEFQKVAAFFVNAEAALYKLSPVSEEVGEDSRLPPRDDKGALLSEIRGGKTLRKVKPSERTPVKSEGGLHGALREAVEGRRGAINPDDADEKDTFDDSWLDDDDWNE